jgi:hypothetical protein
LFRSVRTYIPRWTHARVCSKSDCVPECSIVRNGVRDGGEERGGGGRRRVRVSVAVGRECCHASAVVCGEVRVRGHCVFCRSRHETLCSLDLGNGGRLQRSLSLGCNRFGKLIRWSRRVHVHLGIIRFLRGGICMGRGVRKVRHQFRVVSDFFRFFPSEETVAWRRRHGRRRRGGFRFSGSSC